ncbi:M16 family metallopeptidase [Salinarimonas ramus]|uniref:Peptidase M16 n=1 Tax=Salinarimonas ramus TaxID=690164 RepID=A0A917Q980_9HYPH|nr:pitrilysin family protein [Salinarimonas ramus]GGK35786.1 peptidase M16 [Salinarimonas ramus]
MTLPRPDYRETRLENGLTIVTEAMPHVATVALGVWIGAGARDEAEGEHGLSHLLEHMAFKGTERRSAQAIAEDIENVGGDINAATSVEYTCYTARVLGEDTALALDVLGDILTASTFDPTELERERGVILQEIAAVEDAPDDLVGDLFVETAYPGQPLGRPILGRPETVSAFTPDALRGFVATHYRPERMVIVAAGAVDHDVVVDAAHRFYGVTPAGSGPIAPPATYRGGEKRLQRKHEQVNLMLGLPGRSFRDEDYYATQLFAQVLGGSISSRLWQEVREKRGLAYSVDAFHWPFSDTGVFGIGAGFAEGDAKAFMDVAIDTLRETAETLTEVELARAKAQVKVGLLAALETPGGRIERLARQILAWGRIVPMHELVERVEAVDVEATRAAGRALLTGAPTLAAIGPLKTLPKYAAIAGRLRG